ncbi:MAG: ABC transporter permease subunit [Gammaproteobacteria bacterium]
MTRTRVAAGQVSGLASAQELSTPRGLLATLLERLQHTWRRIVIGVPYIWLLVFFLVPFIIVLKIAFAEATVARPPFSALLQWGDSALPGLYYTFENFQYLIEDSLYYTAYLNSVKLAFLSVILCLLVGFPMAYGIARSSPATKNILLLLVILPFWTSFLLRVYAWIGIMSKQGVLNNALMWLGVIDEPLPLMHTDFAVLLGITYSYLPFMILPLYANLEKLDPSLMEAAADLGARPARTFIDVTLPLAVPGIIAGSLLVFIPAVGEYVIPALMGGAETLMVGRVLFDEFFLNRDWPVASAVAIVLLVLLVAPIVFFQHYQMRQAEAR